MLLKKQTVWLLTMLSLVVVLSVYYITSPEQRGNDLATPEQEEQMQNEEEASQTDVEDEDTAIITNAAGDEKFTALRMQSEDDRSMKKEELQTVMGSTDLPAEEINEAKEEFDKLNELADKEAVLESLIRSMNYEDVLVRADESNVLVTVKAEELSRTAANDIIRQVKNEIGDLQLVTVEFQPK
ncbi:stage III sporulation protein AH [Cytobacillus eiseniae]|uniref:Stage III sporulation protein AH n=1 Tax=Cytobacillus eiseniae TaxID=762947 RepID=A0ABS4RD57_9BACI|nr:SpoIIIAH-like family protein [Cytobacillus eiseniae]MBP2240828.1 stage III sporulation protein AH [Cytobacillus eiseniae]